jgi:hypothetical protein
MKPPKPPKVGLLTHKTNLFEMADRKLKSLIEVDNQKKDK